MFRRGHPDPQRCEIQLANLTAHLVPSAAARAIAVLNEEYAEWSKPKAARRARKETMTPARLPGGGHVLRATQLAGLSTPATFPPRMAAAMTSAPQASSAS
jgi:hypothetical protein